MSEMIERVARAIVAKMEEQQLGTQSPWHDPEFRRDACDCARAAIQAMRDPIGDMLDAGAATMGLPPAFELHLCDVRPDIADILIGCLDGQPSKTWRAMVGAALHE